MLSRQSTVVATKEHVSCDLAGEAVILSLKDGIYYSLDPVGARIWSLIQGPKIVTDVRDTIMDEYSVGSDRCEQDLLKLLKQLEENGLIKVVA